MEPPRAEVPDIVDMGAAAAAGAMEPGIGEAGMLTPDEAGDVKVEAEVRPRSSWGGVPTAGGKVVRVQVEVEVKIHSSCSLGSPMMMGSLSNLKIDFSEYWCSIHSILLFTLYTDIPIIMITIPLLGSTWTICWDTVCTLGPARCCRCCR